ncbi:hypothetical protein [Longimycelium tulufanense]|uniref:hypothetical protein n=1 Tax=Longimycelium tulufanense TaxID=907463 RepID=UPI001E332154|nr:hypothetical protein [Longimycelium tulufanense]
MRQHVQALYRLGWSAIHIAKAANTTESHVIKILEGKPRHTRKETARAILALPLVPGAAERQHHNPVGTVRRLHALMRVGWSAHTIAQRCGSTLATIRGASRGIVSYRTASLVAQVYEELSGTPGDNPNTAKTARVLGYPSPMAWDDDTIDDPKAKPRGIANKPAPKPHSYVDGCVVSRLIMGQHQGLRPSRAERDAALLALDRAGLNYAAIGGRLGMDTDSAERALMRAKARQRQGQQKGAA